MNKLIYCAFLGLALAAPATARPAPEVGAPAQVSRLLACRALTDGVARLACFDRETASMAGAIATKDLVVIDRERVREARKGLFGFSVPSFGGLFGGGDAAEESQLTGIVATANRNADGGWTVHLQDGSVWTQVDDTPVALAPKPGTRVLITRAAMGSFKLKLGSQPNYRAKRIG
jgi:hypothetical protein